MGATKAHIVPLTSDNQQLQVSINKHINTIQNKWLTLTYRVTIGKDQYLLIQWILVQ